MTIGQKIKQIRQSKGMSLEDVAKGMGSSRQRVCAIEHGDMKNIGIQTLEQVAKGLDCSIFDILDEPYGRYYDAPISNPDFDSPCEHAKECPFFKKGEKP